LRAGTHIKPHAGPRAATLRVHCTLRTFDAGPATATLRVGGETRQWKEGECFAFDESWEHEVVCQGNASTLTAAGDGGGNNGGGDDDVRIVLIVDVANPFVADEDDFREAVTATAWAAHAADFRKAMEDAERWAPPPRARD
jgi:aspartate beta-hydroxylase